MQNSPISARQPRNASKEELIAAALSSAHHAFEGETSDCVLCFDNHGNPISYEEWINSDSEWME